MSRERQSAAVTAADVVGEPDLARDVVRRRIGEVLPNYVTYCAMCGISSPLRGSPRCTLDLLFLSVEGYGSEGVDGRAVARLFSAA